MVDQGGGVGGGEGAGGGLPVAGEGRGLGPRGAAAVIGLRFVTFL